MAVRRTFEVLGERTPKGDNNAIASLALKTDAAKIGSLRPNEFNDAVKDERLKMRRVHPDIG